MSIRNFNPRIKFDELKDESALEIIRIAASANEKMVGGESISECFAALSRACTPMLILDHWREWLTYTPIEESELDKQSMTEDEVLNQPSRYDPYGDDSDIVQPGTGINETGDEPILIARPLYNFVKIMCKDPEWTTAPEEREAFRLLPDVFDKITSGW